MPLCSSDSFAKENENELLLNISQLPEESTQYRKAVIGYMGGYVVRQLLKDLSCPVCAEALVDDGKLDSSYSHLVRIKNRGGLFTPSEEVCRVIEVCDKFFRAMSIASNGEQQISPDGFLFKKLCVSILSELIHQPGNLFSCLDLHDFDHEVLGEDMHSLQIVKMIIKKYLTPHQLLVLFLDKPSALKVIHSL